MEAELNIDAFALEKGILQSGEDDGGLSQESIEKLSDSDGNEDTCGFQSHVSWSDTSELSSPEPEPRDLQGLMPEFHAPGTWKEKELIQKSLWMRDGVKSRVLAVKEEQSNSGDGLSELPIYLSGAGQQEACRARGELCTPQFK
ncbi:hypothetical protein PPACK8108_LOCUS6441 [Phakopsora pachyrhizi]|uniref:Uncharacterized protein n=1 Tax=Phakopsora pachyrhizi TaxID=170000 RepID=A0AAV0AQX6_PHAPC|nr:hypothetical protein PPACK8108_LOCUS6441 [Phakopsora pachyrhizi]